MKMVRYAVNGSYENLEFICFGRCYIVLYTIVAIEDCKIIPSVPRESVMISFC